MTHQEHSKFQLLPDPPPGKTGWPWTDPPEPSSIETPDGSHLPKISVVTPSYNQGEFIEETIRSVLLQGYNNLEFIIIDGGSTDQTLEIIDKYAPWLTHWESKPDRGQSHAVNKGIKIASGEILLWLNSDDTLLPNAFAIVVNEYQNHPDPKLVIGQAQIIDVNGNVIGDMISEFTSWEDMVTTPNNRIRQISSFFSPSLFTDYGMLNENIHISMDTDVLVRFTKHHSPIIVPDYLAAFRTQPDAKSALQLLQGYKETDEIRKKMITDQELLAHYKKNSTKNWINLSRMSRYSRKDKWDCLFQAVKINPRILFSKAYWSAVKKFLLGITV